MKTLSPMKAIRAKCLDCCCGQRKEVRLCAIDWCPLYPYRMGHRPLKGETSSEASSSEKVEIDGIFSVNEGIERKGAVV